MIEFFHSMRISHPSFLESNGTSMGSKHFGEGERQEWIGVMTKLFDKWESLPVSGSGRVLYTKDKEVLEKLRNKN